MVLDLLDLLDHKVSRSPRSPRSSGSDRNRCSRFYRTFNGFKRNSSHHGYILPVFVAGTGDQTPSIRTAFSFNASTGTLTVGGDLNSGSDERLKENIVTIENALETIENLRGVRFNWKESGKPSLGVIAQELEEVIPELVNGDENKTVTYNGLIAVVIEALKELKERVKVLEENSK